MMSPDRSVFLKAKCSFVQAQKTSESTCPATNPYLFLASKFDPNKLPRRVAYIYTSPSPKGGIAQQTSTTNLSWHHRNSKKYISPQVKNMYYRPKTVVGNSVRPAGNQSVGGTASQSETSSRFVGVMFGAFVNGVRPGFIRFLS